MRIAAGIGGMLALLIAAAPSHGQEGVPLVLENKIPLGGVSGRIDHMAADVGRGRVMVAELGNDSLAAVDVKGGKVLRTVGGLGEPQGVGYASGADTVYVANARDGSVRIFKGEDLSPAGRIDLGADADNVRVDPAANRVYVGYGGGALAAIDPVAQSKLGDIRLAAHPEGFQLDPASPRIFVNLPSTHEITVVDRVSGRQTATWREAVNRGNFPMAYDAAEQRLLIVFRQSPRLVARAAEGPTLAVAETCGDADDVFVDPKRRRVYVSCGEGFVDAFERHDAGYARIGHVPTAPGARTSLFVPEFDRLYVAVPGAAAEPAALWVFRPAS